MHPSTHSPHCAPNLPPRMLQQELLGLGLHIGITGWICDDRPDRGAAALAQLLPLVPDDRLLLETDAPYLVPRSIVPAKARPSRCVKSAQWEALQRVLRRENPTHCLPHKLDALWCTTLTDASQERACAAASSVKSCCGSTGADCGPRCGCDISQRTPCVQVLSSAG